MRRKELIIIGIMVASMTLLTACSGCGKEEPTVAVETMVAEAMPVTEVEELIESTIEEVEATTVEEVVEETTEEIAKLETKYTIEKADVFAEANEESQILMTLDINHEVEVIGEVQDTEFTEITWNEGTAFIKTILLSDEPIELHEDWGSEKTEEQKQQEVEAEAEASTNEVSQQDMTPQPAPQGGGQTQAQQDAFKALEAAGIHLQGGTVGNAPGVGDGHGDLHGKTIVLH